MADKNINFNIKVNNKELDLTKTSFKDFDNIIKQAKKDLQALPISDPRYKVLQTDIKNADAAWKEMNKTISQSGDEMEDAGGKVETYKKQIKEATDELFRLEQQFGKNSKEYTDQQQKIAGLRDAQEELVRTTQDLDDTLAAIPGPIGQIGQGMQQLEGITQNVGSAMVKLGIDFKTTDGILKASGIGALVLLVATLVAALVDAAKKSEPLQQAFAAIGDAVGALFDALKPVTDFLINVFVGAINLVSSAIEGLASLFGGVNKGFKQQSLALEKELNFQKAALEGFNDILSENLNERLKIEQDYLTKKKEIADKTYKNELERNRDELLLEISHKDKLNALDLKTEQDRAKRVIDVFKIKESTNNANRDNERKNSIESLETQGAISAMELKMLRESNQLKINEFERNATILKVANIANRQELELLNQKGLNEALKLQKNLNDQEIAVLKNTNAEKSKLQRGFNREDVAAINERNNEILQLTTELIKEDNARNYKAAQDALVILKEQHRKEIESANLAGLTLTKLKEKQTAENIAAQEKVRLAKIQLDSYEIQQEIDKQNRLVTEVGVGTQEYYNAKKEIVNKELEQEILLADGNENKIQNARTKHWKAMLDIEKEGVQSQIDILNIEYSTLYEGSVAFYQKQRELENKNYEAAQLEAQGNYDKLEALRKQHEKNMKMIDLSELQSTVDILQRQADTKQKLFQGYYKAQLEAEEADYGLKLKAAGDNYALIETLEKEHRQRKRMMREQELSDYIQMYTQMSGVVSGFLAEQDKVNQLENQLATQRLEQKYKAQNDYDKRTITDATELKNKLVKNDKDKAKEEDDIKRKYFYINKNSQIAQATIATLQAAVQAYSALAGIPVVGPALGAAAAAVALGFGYTQVKLIKQQEYVSTLDTGGETKPAMANYGRSYAQGGLIGGNRHSEGGTLIEAEKGEAILTRGAVTMFGPMLSMMNQAGGGTSFNTNLMTTSYDKPNVSKPSEEQNPIIVKSYVVSSELTSEQNKQARLKDLSTL